MNWKTGIYAMTAVVMLAGRAGLGRLLGERQDRRHDRRSGQAQDRGRRLQPRHRPVEGLRQLLACHRDEGRRVRWRGRIADGRGDDRRQLTRAALATAGTRRRARASRPSISAGGAATQRLARGSGTRDPQQEIVMLPGMRSSESVWRQL